MSARVKGQKSRQSNSSVPAAIVQRNGVSSPCQGRMSLLEILTAPDGGAGHSGVFVISPAEAGSILADRNDGNRHISVSLIEHYAGLMKEGLWKLNGETVIFGSDGRLLDGQHRLKACARSGVPFVTWVVFGADPQSFDTIGRGKKRSTADDLGIEGEINTRHLASTLALLWLHEAKDKTLEMIGDTPPSSVARTLLRYHPDLRESVRWVASHRAIYTLMPPRIASFCHYQFARKDRAAAYKFFEDFASGAGLAKGDPVLRLRERLINDRMSKSRLPALEILALTIKAWNHRRKGSSVSHLRWRTGGLAEAFPTVE